MGVILTLATNSTPENGVEPDGGRTRKDFPYFGERFTDAEQWGVTPARSGAQKTW
jgi:hypothetical protein